MRLILLSLFPVLALASQILSYNIYDRTDRIDLMLTFDTPYEDVIRQQRTQHSIIVKLDNASIDVPKTKELQSPFLNKMTITPIGSQTQIVARVPSNVVMEASRTSDAYGLRLRFLKQSLSENPSETSQASQNAPAASLSNLPVKNSNDLDSSYYTVIIILIIGIIILLWLKQSLNKTKKMPSTSSLFSPKGKSSADEATIRFKKALDQHNSVMMLDYADESYLVITGNTNVVLDKFHDNKPVNQGEFESMLSAKEQELDSYLQIDRIDNTEVLQSYKEKASQ